MNKKNAVRKITSTGLANFSKVLAELDQNHLQPEFKRFASKLTDYNFWYLDSSDESSIKMVCFETKGNAFFIKDETENNKMVSFFPPTNWKFLCKTQFHAYYSEKNHLFRVGFDSNKTEQLIKFDFAIEFAEIISENSLVICISKSPIRKELVLLDPNGQILSTKEIKNLKPVLNKCLALLGFSTFINSSGEFSVINWLDECIQKIGVYKPVHYWDLCFILANTNKSRYFLLNQSNKISLNEISNCDKVAFFEDNVVWQKKQKLSSSKFESRGTEGIYTSKILANILEFFLMENSVVFLTLNKELGLCMTSPFEYDSLEYSDFLDKKKEYRSVKVGYNDTVYLPVNNENSLFAEIISPDLSTTNIELPISRKIRAFCYHSNQLYCSFEGKGMARFDCITEEIVFNNSLENIRSITVVEDALFVASWKQGLLELDKQFLSISRQFLLPDSAIKIFKVQAWKKLRIVSGYSPDKSGIFIYNNDNHHSTPIEIIEEYGNNISHDFIICNDILFYNGVDNTQRVIKRYNLETSKQETSISVQHDYRYLINYKDKIAAISFDLVTLHGFEVLLLNPWKTEESQRLTLPSKGGGLRSIKSFAYISNYFVCCYSQINNADEEYYFFRFNGTNFIFDFSIGCSSTGFEATHCPWNKNHICLVSPTEIILVDLVEKKRIGSITFFGNDVMFTLTDSPYYFSTNSILVSHHSIELNTSKEKLVCETEQNSSFNDLGKVIEQLEVHSVSPQKFSNYLLKSLPEHLER